MCISVAMIVKQDVRIQHKKKPPIKVSIQLIEKNTFRISKRYDFRYTIAVEYTIDTGCQHRKVQIRKERS